MTSEPNPSAERLRALRGELRRRGLDGFLVPMADEYQNEYVPPHAQRIAWLTGFTGSAGLAVVLADSAAMFTDGRYTLQVRQQVDEALFELHHITESPPTDWLAGHLKRGQKLGYDAWLFTPDQVARFSDAAKRAEAQIIAADGNPLDAVWSDQPARPRAPVVPHDLAYAGESAADKRARLAEALAGKGCEAAVITAADSIAWLFNIRGGDVEHSPLPLAFAVLHADGRCELFLEPEKRADGLEAHLGNAVGLRHPDEFHGALVALGRDGRRILADPTLSAAWVFDRLAEGGAEIVRAADPCQLPKAIKNAVELQGARDAHLRDGAAVVRFLHWLSEAAAAGAVDELAAAERLEAFRRENALFRDLSFPTITGAGPNGTIVHYRATPQSNRKLQPGELYLVDSGA
ncbi:MAG TPA: aminopeptidase P family N-terminal domain-containing protein, partial [Alphaproteobacteria bacterium]|nr:aminopeptidase P family N-terminal domain-containing protein [Alphaproteobacteria bacterium]